MLSRRIEAEPSSSEREDYSSDSDCAVDTENRARREQTPIPSKEKKEKKKSAQKHMEKETKPAKKTAEKEQKPAKKVTEKKTKPAKEVADEDEKPKHVPGNDNFVKATRKRVIGREKIPEDEEAEFDATSVAELKTQLKATNKRTAGTKVDLWIRYMGREVEPEKPAKPAKVEKPSKAVVKARKPAEETKKAVKAIKAVKPKNVDAGEVPYATEIIRRAPTSQKQQTAQDNVDNDDTESGNNSSDDGVDTVDGGQEREVPEEGESNTESVSVSRAGNLKENVWGELVEDGEEEGADSVAGESTQEETSAKPTLKRKKSSSPTDGDKHSEDKRLRLRGGGGRSRGPAEKRAPLRDLVPTDYFVPEDYLAMNLDEVLTSAPELLRLTPPAWKANNEVTLQEFLARHPLHRRRLAELYRDGDSPFTHDEEHWCAELPTDFYKESFADVLDRTPIIWRLWEDDEAAAAAAEDGDGGSGLWTDRWNPERWSGFLPEYLDDGGFMRVVQRFPRFAQFILTAVDNGDLSFETEADRTALERMLDMWEIEKRGEPYPEYDDDDDDEEEEEEEEA